MKLFVQRNLGILVSAFVFLVTILTVSIAISIMGFETSTDNTSVRSIYLGNVEASNRNTVLTSEMNAYLREARLVVVYQGQTFESDLSFLIPDIQATTTGLVQGQNNQAVFMLSETQKAALLNQLEDAFSPQIVAALDQEALTNVILASASNMTRFNYLELRDFMLPSAFMRLHHIELENVSPINGLNVVSRAPSILIPASSRFSLLDALSELLLENTQLSIIASGMQGVLTLSSVTNFQQTMDDTPPAWVQDGMNVRILQLAGQDFTFINVSDTPYEIRITSRENNTLLTFELWGFPPLHTRQAQTTETLALEPFVNVINDNTLDENTDQVIITETATEIIYEVVVDAGVPGRVVDVTRTITSPLGDTFTTLLVREIYDAQPATIRRHVVAKEVD